MATILSKPGQGEIYPSWIPQGGLVTEAANSKMPGPSRICFWLSISCSIPCHIVASLAGSNKMRCLHRPFQARHQAGVLALKVRDALLAQVYPNTAFPGSLGFGMVPTAISNSLHRWLGCCIVFRFHEHTSAGYYCRWFGDTAHT